jgi:hypothetical protein
MTARHLLWIPIGAVVGFGAAYLFGDLLTLPIDLYYLIYFAAVIGFFAIYVKKTGLDLSAWISRRLIRGLVLGLIVGLMMLQNVFSRPKTEPLGSAMFIWALFWRGLIYGGVDGLLLFAFPWIVTWRALGGERARAGRQIIIAVVAWLMILITTTAYHLGYEDFRSPKIVQPNIGSTITSLPTILSANPAASVFSHLFLHVGAVIHCPDTELFLPPHREEPVEISTIHDQGKQKGE